MKGTRRFLLNESNQNDGNLSMDPLNLKVKIKFTAYREHNRQIDWGIHHKRHETKERTNLITLSWRNFIWGKRRKKNRLFSQWSCLVL